MQTLLQKLLEAGVDKKLAVGALTRHIKLVGDYDLLTPDLVTELTVPLPVQLETKPSPPSADPLAEMADDRSYKSHEWSKHKTLAEVLLFLAYKTETTIIRTQEQLNDLVRKIYYKHGKMPKIASGHGFRLILSRLRTGGYYADFPKIDTTGPTQEGLIFIEPRLAALDRILGVKWSEWLEKVEREKNEA